MVILGLFAMVEILDLLFQPPFNQEMFSRVAIDTQVPQSRFSFDNALRWIRLVCVETLSLFLSAVAWQQPPDVSTWSPHLAPTAQL